MGLFFDFSDGDIGFELSDKILLKSDGDIMFRLGEHVAMDLDSGNINIVSGSSKSEASSEDDEL